MIFFAAARYGVLSPQRTRIAHESAAPDLAGS
jgi:hypothetical protein